MRGTRLLMLAFLALGCSFIQAQGLSETLVSARFQAPLTEVQCKLIYEQCRGLDPHSSVVLVQPQGELELRSLAGIPPEVFLDALTSVQDLTIEIWDDHVGRPFRPAMHNGPQTPSPAPAGAGHNVRNEDERR